MDTDTMSYNTGTDTNVVYASLMSNFIYTLPQMYMYRYVYTLPRRTVRTAMKRPDGRRHTGPEPPQRDAGTSNQDSGNG